MSRRPGSGAVGAGMLREGPLPLKTPSLNTVDHIVVCFSQNVGRKMSANDFIENLRDLNDGRNFDAAMLQDLYASIKNQPLEMEL